MSLSEISPDRVFLRLRDGIAGWPAAPDRTQRHLDKHCKYNRLLKFLAKTAAPACAESQLGGFKRHAVCCMIIQLQQLAEHTNEKRYRLP